MPSLKNNLVFFNRKDTKKAKKLRHKGQHLLASFVRLAVKFIGNGTNRETIHKYDTSGEL